MRVVGIGEHSFGANCYAVISDSHALVVDPTLSVSAIMSAIAAEGAMLEGIILTHGHFDHVTSLDTLRDAAKIPAYIHEDDAELLTDGKKNAFSIFFGKERVWRAAEHTLSDGDVIPLGNEYIKVIHTPGHTQGSVCYLCGDTIITGDTLFADNIGRTALYGGSFELLADSLKKLRSFDPKLKLCAGHGPDGILGEALDNSAYFF